MGTPYTKNEARLAAEHHGVSPYHKELILWLLSEVESLEAFRDLMLRDCGLENPQREVLVKETARKCLEVAGKAEMSLSGSPNYYEALRKIHLWIRREFGLEGPVVLG